MLKRLMLETLFIFTLLLAFMLYGAVTARDTRDSAEPQLMQPAQEIVVTNPAADEDSSVTAETKVGRENASAHAGMATVLSARVSRFFLEIIGTVSAFFRQLVLLH
ncbi:MAG: hypothetical protein LKI80_00345 [Sporolactobacillus sp.]|jgi:hypothetical protein|nr:hypothetical protein [Sporolactobacillus sp.]